MPSANRPGLASRIAGQGALLFSGFALAQVLSFARNALLAQVLSKGDFGIAAAILLLLQTIETLSDLGADRLIVQDRDGDDARFVATAHAALVLRGLVTALVIAACAWPLARFFGVAEAAWGFAAIALSPLIRSFVHLDARRVQRRLDNRPQVLIEVVPQILALALAWPAVTMTGSYAAVIALALAQALAAVAVSHAMAERRYALAFDRAHMRRLLAFGWPIWASAFPLVAVYQGDRMLIGHLAGVEALAAYTVAFMITMVPGLVAGKVGNALMLPLLTGVRDDMQRFNDRFLVMIEATAVAAAAYLAAFVLLGGTIVELAFGKAYAGLGAVVAWLALMWSMRMLQATLGIALMAHGTTRPFLVAGLVRALGLPLAFGALYAGFGLEGAAAAGALAELVSLLYVGWRLQSFDATESGMRLGTAALLRTSPIVPAGVAALALAQMPVVASSLSSEIVATAAVLVMLAIGGVLALPGLRACATSRSSVA
jgi:O-antigen/teichoic acid export membrane protein